MQSVSQKLILPFSQLDYSGQTDLISLVHEHPLIVIRQGAPLSKENFLDFSNQFGKLLEWDFGFIFDLQIKADPKNYLFARGSVPFHWDGAFAGEEPRFIIFYCCENTVQGGSTIFCHTPDVIKNLSENEMRRLSDLEVEYSTQKIAHYGGTFSSKVIIEKEGGLIIKFAEPHRDDTTD